MKMLHLFSLVLFIVFSSVNWGCEGAPIEDPCAEGYEGAEQCIEEEPDAGPLPDEDAAVDMDAQQPDSDAGSDDIGHPSDAGLSPTEPCLEEDGSGTILSGWCYIDDECYEGGYGRGAGEDEQKTGCLYCDSGDNQGEWTPRPDDTLCTIQESDDVAADMDEWGLCLDGVCTRGGCICDTVGDCCDGCMPRNVGESCQSGGADGAICIGGECVVPVTGIKVEPDQISLLPGETSQLQAVVEPGDATPTTVTWVSSSPSVVGVDGTGLVIAESLGEATITATTEDGSYSDTCEVTVKCPLGWEGEACDVPICSPACQNGGICIAPDTCLAYSNIPAGTFWMGSPDGNCPANYTDYLGNSGSNCILEAGRTTGRAEELREVTLTIPFLLQTSPVTQAQYEQVLSAEGNNPKGLDTTPSHFANRPGNPVERVNWYESLAFANAMSRLEGLEECFDCTDMGNKVNCSLKGFFSKPQDCKGYRLPTESEWEYAARAGSVGPFHTTTMSHENNRAGQEAALDTAGWYSGNRPGSSTQPVGDLEPNAWGLYDMHGNVYERTWDWYVADKTGYAGYTGVDPFGPSEGSNRVYRGGSWFFDARDCRAANAYAGPPGGRGNGIGFRLCRSIL